MAKSSSKLSNRSSRSNGGRSMSSNSNRRAKPLVPKAGFTTYRSRYGKGGSV